MVLAPLMGQATLWWCRRQFAGDLRIRKDSHIDHELLRSFDPNLIFDFSFFVCLPLNLCANQLLERSSLPHAILFCLLTSNRFPSRTHMLQFSPFGPLHKIQKSEEENWNFYYFVIPLSPHQLAYPQYFPSPFPAPYAPPPLHAFSLPPFLQFSPFSPFPPCYLSESGIYANFSLNISIQKLLLSITFVRLFKGVFEEYPRLCKGQKDQCCHLFHHFSQLWCNKWFCLNLPYKVSLMYHHQQWRVSMN